MVKRQGFTLIELLVVISIVGMLASIVLVSLNSSRAAAKIAAGRQFEANVYHAVGDRAVSVWDMNDCAGTSVRDSSANNNIGTLTNFNPATAWDASSPSSNGCSLLFDGTDDWVSVAQPAIQVSPNKFTVSMWIYPDNQYSRFLTPQSNGTDQWIGYDPSSQRIEVFVTEIADVNNRTRYSSDGSVPLNKWTQVTVSINDKNIKIYVNGKLDSEYTETINIGNWDGPWVIGQRGLGAQWYKGKIENLRVFSDAL